MYKETKEKWRLANRDRINKRRKELRFKRKQEKMAGKKCELCEILMVGRCYRATVYCNECTQRWKNEINKFACKKYYYKNKNAR